MRYNADPNPIEPSLSDRLLALLHAQLYVAHLERGFTPEQAIDLTKFTMAMTMQADEEEYDG